MRNKLQKAIIIGIGIALLVSDHNAYSQEPLSQVVKPLMAVNFDALVHLERLAAQKEGLESKAGRQKAKGYLEQLMLISHTLPDAVTLDKKPGLKAVSQIFTDYLNGLKLGIEDGDANYLRNRIQTLTNLCFSCHASMLDSKKQGAYANLAGDLPANPLQRGNFYVAIRQFDKGLNAYRDMIAQTPLRESDVYQWTQALKNALSVSVRVHQDPELTLNLLNLASKQNEISTFMKKNLAQWKKDATEWKLESQVKGSPAVMLNKATNLIDRGQSNQVFSSGHVSDIVYLRAINYVHQALSYPLKPGEEAGAYYLLGVANGALEDPFLWELDQYYFKACIQKYPHTSLSQKCYDHLASGVYFGFTGSAGTYIPDDSQKELEMLRGLAE